MHRLISRISWFYPARPIKNAVMIRMIQSTSEGHAKAYFSDALSKSDYYIDGQELSGRLQGRLRDRLGLGSEVSKDIFFALCENRNPLTGSPLTPRTKEGRRVGYDINFHAPKSVSILHALSKDSHIADSFQKSVNEVMQAMEADCQTRVRKGGAEHNRPTDELIWAEFLHQTARPVEGHAPDPHLHMHCFTFNMTWDKEEQRIKAGDFAEIKRDMPYYEALFHKVFSDKLIEQGYSIRKTAKSFEIEGVPKAVIDLFSKRTDEIGRYAKEHGITNPDKLSELGARTRSAKDKGLTMSDLKTAWKEQIKELKAISEEEKHKDIRYAKTPSQFKIPVNNCVDYALTHSFERVSVIPERRLLASAFRHGIGDRETSCEAIAEAIKSDTRIIKVKEKQQWKCTTKEVLAEEKEMVELARKGQGQIKPLYQEAPAINLKGQQARAVEYVLTTPHRVSIVRGVAGAGKTTIMKEASRLIEAKSKLTVVAPSGTASREVLKGEGFDKANTVARLLIDKEMQTGIKNGVLWVDEAGLLGTKDMLALIKLATNQNAQLIFGGDTRQHASVVRGDALRVLNTIARIRTAEVSKIYRQKDLNYSAAVKDLSEGKIKSAFDRLETMKAITQIDPLNPNEDLVKDYVAFEKENKTALIISPTHKQGEKLTEDIRFVLKKAGKIGKKEITAKKLTNLNFTEAEKSDWRNMKPGQQIQFNQNLQKIKRGSLWTIKTADKVKVEIVNEDGVVRKLPTNKADRFDILEMSEMKIAKGDKIMATRGSFDLNKKRVDSGQTFHVVDIKQGKIKLQNNFSKAVYEVDKDFGHLTHAHCITSYAAQGKTVDHVLISQPASTFAATDSKQFYVSVSRGKYSAKIYTDDKEMLLQYASQYGDRQSAIELVENDEREKTHLGYVIDNQRKQQKQFEKEDVKQKENFKPSFEKDYEP